LAVVSEDRSQNFSRSKSKVKFDFCTVRTRVIPILKGIEVKMYPSKIGRARGWKKQHVAYYVCKLEKAGLIRRVKRSSFVDYELTERGQNFLVSCESVLFSSGVFRLHRCFFKFPIVREGVYPSGDFRRVEMRRISTRFSFHRISYFTVSTMSLRSAIARYNDFLF
jgi:predicted transcriptional regulator